MKKFTLLYSLTLLILCSCSTPPPTIENDLTRRNIKGRVKSYTESYFDTQKKLNKVSISKTPHLKTVYEFNEGGILTSYSEYGASGRLEYVKRYKYNANGGVDTIEIKSASGGAMGMEIFKYDDAGNMIDHYEFDGEGHILSSISRTYNDKGQVLEKEILAFDEYDPISSNTVYEYDKIGNVIKTVVTDLYTYEVSQQMEYTYDSKGREVKMHNILLSSDTEATTTKEYDHMGNIIKITEYGAYELLLNTVEYENKYDETGNLIKQISYYTPSGSSHRKTQGAMERTYEYYE